jgi:putative ABC transport system permease protein
MLNIILTILEQGAIYLPLVLGAYCAFSLLKIPYLAIESAFVFGALLTSHAIFLKLPILVVLLVSLFVAMLAGAMVGLLTFAIKYYAKVSFLLASIISIGFFHGINQFVIRGAHISLNVDKILSILPSVRAYPHLTTLIIISFFIIMLFYIFIKSQIGLSCAIYGNNSNFFEHYNISTNYVCIIGIIISSSLAGLSGFLSAYNNGFADISMGFGINLLCITALVLGKTFSNRKYSFIIPCIGILIYLIIQQFLLKINFDSQYFSTVQAVVVFLLLTMTQKFTKEKSNELGL